MPGAAADILALQRLIGNQATIQRFLGARGTNLAGQNVPVTFEQDFTDKHIAANAQGAITNTLNRINNNNAPSSMKDGTLANTVATQAAWTAAIDASQEKMPPLKDWEPDIGDYKDKFDNWVLTLADAWEVTRTDPGADRAQTARTNVVKGHKRAVSGSWEIVNDNELSAKVNHATIRGI
jgi:hypothetical protein